jgi:hypothetical protein
MHLPFLFVKYSSRNNGRLAFYTGKAALGPGVWGSIRRDRFPARLSAHWKGGMQAPVRLLSFLVRLYCHADIAPARWRGARALIEWLCSQERWNPDVAIPLGTAARYRQAMFLSPPNPGHFEHAARRTGNPRAKRQNVSQAELSGEQLLASNLAAAVRQKKLTNTHTKRTNERSK